MVVPCGRESTLRCSSVEVRSRAKTLRTDQCRGDIFRVAVRPTPPVIVIAKGAILAHSTPHALQSIIRESRTALPTMGGFMGFLLGVQHSRNEQKKVKSQKFANSRRGQRIMDSGQMKRYIKKREAALQKGADLRKGQEEDISKGERVWFSRCILNGRLQHWVLLTHGMKYELRRRDHLNKGFPDSNTDNQDVQNEGESTGEYVCNIKPYTIDQERRDISLTKLLIPEVDGYYICLVGWTRLTEPEVNNIAQTVLSSFGRYSLLRNNCQDFLRQLAEKILIASKAADFDWFMSNAKTKYQKDQWLKPPPEEMLMRMINGMMAQQQAMNISLVNQNQIQMQMQNQMLMQNQIQMQNQMQMQIQSQMQMQMQMQMGGAGA